MNIPKVLLFLLLLFLMTPVSCFAQTSSSSAVPPGRSNAGVADNAQAMTNLKNRANQEIERRVAPLNRVITKINGLKKLTTEQKTSLTTLVQTEITNLTNLKAKIAAASDMQTLRADVQSIITSYRVYALFIPQIELLAAANTLSDVSDTFTTIATNLQSQIQIAQNIGKEVSLLTTLLTDMQSKITDATTQAQNVISAVLPLSPSGYPGNKVTLQNARGMLRTGRSDLQLARQDIKSIIQGLKTSNASTSGLTRPLQTPDSKSR